MYVKSESICLDFVHLILNNTVKNHKTSFENIVREQSYRSLDIDDCSKLRCTENRNKYFVIDI